MAKPLAIVITGPTASGKSALAISLARQLETEIISADSRQIYKGIPVSTAVPSIEDRQGISHHLLESLSLEDYYSAAKFDEDARQIMKNLFQEKGSVIVCGGSMLYIDALIEGIDELPTVPEEIRNNLTEEWHEKGSEWLLDMLGKLDPQYLRIVDKKNLKRVFHAVEISLTSGQPYSSLLDRKKPERDFDVVKVILEGPRDILFEKINSRVLKMIESGLEEEARNVFHLRHLNSLNTVGLKEMFAWFDGLMTREEAIARIQKNTRVYAKKQITWHKKDQKAARFDFTLQPEVNTVKILEIVRNRNLP